MIIFAVDLEMALQVALEMKFLEQFIFSRSIFNFNNDVVIKSTLDTLQVILLCHSLHNTEACDLFAISAIGCVGVSFFLFFSRGYWDKFVCKNVSRHFFRFVARLSAKILLDDNKLLSTIVIKRKQIFNYRSWNI